MTVPRRLSHTTRVQLAPLSAGQHHSNLCQDTSKPLQALGRRLGIPPEALEGLSVGAPLGQPAAFGASGAVVNGAAHAGAAGGEEEAVAMPADINLEEARCAPGSCGWACGAGGRSRPATKHHDWPFALRRERFACQESIGLGPHAPAAKIQKGCPGEHGILRYSQIPIEQLRHSDAMQQLTHASACDVVFWVCQCLFK